MDKIRSFIFVFFTLFFAIFCYLITNFSTKTVIEENLYDSIDKELNFETKVFADTSYQKKYNEISNEDLKSITLPYKPNTQKADFWFDLKIPKKDNLDSQPFILVIENSFIDFKEVYILNDDTWEPFNTRIALSNITSKQLLPILNHFYKNDNLQLRLKMTSSKGNPINIKILSYTKVLYSITRTLSRFFLHFGIFICIFFILVLIGFTLKDPSYFILAFTSFIFILRSIQTTDLLFLLFLNKSSIFLKTYLLEYILGCIETISLSFFAYFFISINRKKKGISKTLIAIIELGVIEFLLFATINSAVTIFILYNIISILQKGLLIYDSYTKIKRNNDCKTIFFHWIIALSFSIFHKAVILLQNFTDLSVPRFSVNHDLIALIFGFLLLFIPPIYFVGKRFNLRYQYIQKEYQNLETKFIENIKAKKLTNKVYGPITTLTSSVLNSACILSKLNFSATNAKYIELIKKESARINDLFVGIQILEGTEEIKRTPILLLSFYNSCMAAIKKFLDEQQCKASITTAIENDTIITADSRILQLLFIIIPMNIIYLSKQNSKISFFAEEKENTLSITITNKFESEKLNSSQSIIQNLNKNPYFEFLNELSKIYKGTYSISPFKDSCTTTWTLNFEKIQDTTNINVVTDKTNFAMSVNSIILFENEKKQNKSEVERKENSNQKKERIDPLPQEKESIKKTIEEETSENEIKDDFSSFNFSFREKEIATLIIEGKSDKEIAFELNISPQTVATHNKKIFKKADVHSRVELINKVR